MKRQKVNRRVEFAQTKDKRPRAKKSFTQLYGVSRVHRVRGMALNAAGNSFETKYVIPKLGGVC